MKTRVVELTDGFNWGKFLVAKFDEAEWSVRSAVDGQRLLRGRGWSERHLFILDLQTGEGAIFLPGGQPKADLDKHAVWVCPMFELFLGWLYARPRHWDDLGSLPALVELTQEETRGHSALWGYRRPGPDQAERDAAAGETRTARS